MKHLLNITIAVCFTLLSIGVYAQSRNLNYIVKKNKKVWGYTDSDGKVVIPYQFEYAEKFKGDWALVKKKDKWGYIDKKGIEVIPIKFQSLTEFSEDLAAFQQKDLLGVYGQKRKRNHCPQIRKSGYLS